MAQCGVGCGVWLSIFVYFHGLNTHCGLFQGNEMISTGSQIPENLTISTLKQAWASSNKSLDAKFRYVAHMIPNSALQYYILHSQRKVQKPRKRENSYPIPVRPLPQSTK